MNRAAPSQAYVLRSRKFVSPTPPACLPNFLPCRPFKAAHSTDGLHRYTPVTHRLSWPTASHHKNKKTNRNRINPCLALRIIGASGVCWKNSITAKNPPSTFQLWNMVAGQYVVVFFCVTFYYGFVITFQFVEYLEGICYGVMIMVQMKFIKWKIIYLPSTWHFTMKKNSRFW